MSIKIESLTHVYMPGSPFEKVALKDINLIPLNCHHVK